MPIPAQFAVKSAPFCTHNEDYDTLLVRVGHHLWQWHKQDQRNTAIYEALEAVWAAKEEYRAPIRIKNAQNRAAAGERLRTRRFS